MISPKKLRVGEGGRVRGHLAGGQPRGAHGDGRAPGAGGALGVDAQLHQALYQVLNGALPHARHAVQHERAAPRRRHRRAQWPAPTPTGRSSAALPLGTARLT